MYIDLSVRIERSPEDVFDFLLYKDRIEQAPGSPVLVLEKLTPGTPGVGTQYREVLRMPMGSAAEVLSCVTRCEPPRFLEEDFAGPGPMRGHLAYELLGAQGSTVLRQREMLEVIGPLRILSGPIRLALGRRIRMRLADIKATLESGWQLDQHALSP